MAIYHKGKLALESYEISRVNVPSERLAGFLGALQAQQTTKGVTT